MAWTLELFRTVDGLRLGELPSTAFTWTSGLRTGQMEGKSTGLGSQELGGLKFSLDSLEQSGWLDRTQPGWQARLASTLMPVKHGIMALYDGRPIEGGPIGENVDIDPDGYRLTVDSFSKLLRDRYLVPEDFTPTKQITAKGRALGALAMRALEVGMAKPSGGLPVELPPVEVGTDSQIWKAYNVASLSVLEKIESLADVDGGPDIAFRPKVADDSHFVWEAQHGTSTQPYLGQSVVQDWEEGSPDVESLTARLSAAHVAHRVYAVGGGNDVSTPVEREQDLPRDGWPLIERVVTDSSISAVPDQDEWKKTAEEANADLQAAADAAQQKADAAAQKAADADSKKTAATVAQTKVTTAKTFSWPFPLSSVSSEYGPRPGVGKGYHDGIDFAQPGGAAIPAIADGTVTSVGIHSDAGPYAIDIDHGSGIHSQYWHCSAKLVSTGQTVKRGQTIGRVGTRGLSTGNHLHLEIHAPNSPSDRATWPPRDFMSSYSSKSVATIEFVQAESASEKAAKAARAAATAAKKAAQTAKKKADENLKAEEKAAEKAATIKQRAWAAKQLSALARASVAPFPMLQLELVVRADGANPLGTFWPGETARVTVHDHPALSEGTYELRILEMSGSDEASVKLTFEPIQIEQR